MSKRTTPLGSAHQIGPEIHFHGILTIVARHNGGGESVGEGSLKIGTWDMFLPTNPQQKLLWSNISHSWIRWIQNVQKNSSTGFRLWLKTALRKGNSSHLDEKCVYRGAVTP